MRYLFYPSADRRQDEIWDYTCKTWGETQAEKYLRGLHAHLEKLVERKLAWHRLPMQLLYGAESMPQAYVTRYEKHYIFFKPLSDQTIGVMSILHESMDIPVRLREDIDHIA